jgi:hypothetical protein
VGRNIFILAFFGKANHSACNARAGITGLAGFGVAALSQIILILVQYNATPNNG